MAIPIVVERDDYKYLVFTAEPLEVIDDNVDVEIHLKTENAFLLHFSPFKMLGL